MVESHHDRRSQGGIKEREHVVASFHRAVAGCLRARARLGLSQSYPNRPVTLIVPWPAGGPTDTHLRKLAEIAAKYLGQPVVVENRPGGHVMAVSDATGWGRYVDQGAFRLLVTFGEQRTRWGAPTARELGFDVVSYSPYGIVGPKGMDPSVVRILHDAFKKAIDDPEHHKVLQQLDQVYWYKSSADYAKWAAEQFKADRALIERLGLLAK